MFQKAFTIPLSVVVVAGPSNVGNFARALEVDFPRSLSAPRQHCRGPAPRLREKLERISETFRLDLTGFREHLRITRAHTPLSRRQNPSSTNLPHVPYASFLKTNPIVYIHNTFTNPLGPLRKQNSRTQQAFRTSSSGIAIIYQRLRARSGPRATHSTFLASFLHPVVA